MIKEEIKVLELENKILKLEKHILEIQGVNDLYNQAFKKIKSNGWKLEALIGVNMNHIQGGVSENR